MMSSDALGWALGFLLGVFTTLIAAAVIYCVAVRRPAREAGRGRDVRKVWPDSEKGEAGVGCNCKGEKASLFTPRELHETLSRVCANGLRGTAAADQERLPSDHSVPQLPQSLIRPDLAFGPTPRQCGLAEPPMKNSPHVDEETSLQASLTTVQKVLSRRDAQTTELQHQLKEARQTLWLQTVEARSATSRLREVLADPTRAPQAQAETIEELRLEVKELSGRLADAQEQEKYWSMIARRQRAFLLQSEHLGQEGCFLLRRHPCGEVFVVSPPTEEDDGGGHASSRWDVATSHCNPYKVDSWPVEPNVLAHRPSREPHLEQCSEAEEDEAETEEEEEDGKEHD